MADCLAVPYTSLVARSYEGKCPDADPWSVRCPGVRDSIDINRSRSSNASHSSQAAIVADLVGRFHLLFSARPILRRARAVQIPTRARDSSAQISA
ncbi:hypothetical protein MRX96_038615 [Rhipicephalus microplus]